MKISQIINTSLTVLLIGNVFCRFAYLKQKVKDTYQNSYMQRLITIFCPTTKNSLKFSFIGRLTEAREVNTYPLDNSKTIKFFKELYGRFNKKVIFFIQMSNSISFVKKIYSDNYFLSVDTLGIITVTLIVTNIMLLMILQKEIILWGWLLRLGFLFIGISGCSCKSDWKDLVGTSLFLKWVRK